MPRKLKVFRATIGFDDAFVAAPSRKAALAAWGSDADLFARGVADEVTDPELTAAPLAEPGKVVRVSRGDLAAQLKALGPRRKKVKRAEPVERAERGPGPESAPSKRKPGKPKPLPKRDKLDAAEAALDVARARFDEEAGALEQEREALARRIEALRARRDKERARLEAKRDAARESYRAALARWSA